MRIHNVREEQVLKRVKSLYEIAVKKKYEWLSCACERCQNDTACYVLNRIEPKYVVSSRGVAFEETAFNKQNVADIDTLIIEGMHRISLKKRAFHNAPKVDTQISGAAFNFPTFFGAVYAGSSFEPLKNGTVTLFENGELAKMIDGSWTNPAHFSDSVKGSYTFWLEPRAAETADEKRIFTFELKVETKDYEPINTVITVPVISETYAKTELDSTSSFRIQDIFLLPGGKKK